MAYGFTTPGGIRFEPSLTDPGDYDAKAGGIIFSIVKSTDAGFGISAYKVGKNLNTQIAQSGILWCGARKRCVAHADHLLRKHGEDLTKEQQAAKDKFLQDNPHG